MFSTPSTWRTWQPQKQTPKALVGGQQFGPTADRTSRGQAWKSKTGSIVLRHIASSGCIWRIVNAHLLGWQTSPSIHAKPLAANLEAERGYWRHPHGHGLSWLPHACNAHGATPFSLSMFLPWSLVSMPNASSSVASRVSSFSSSSAHKSIEGMTCFTCPTLVNGDHGCISMGPSSGAVSSHHARCRLQGQTASKRRSM